MRTASCRLLAVLAAALVLGACSLPRGAGVQREVLAEARAAEAGRAGTSASDYAVEPVTRESLPVLQAWPAPDESRLSWITHQANPPGMLIAPGDTLSITVWDPADLSLLASPGQRSVQLEATTVGSDGRIFLPYVGQLRVAGMSPEHAREAIEARFLEVVPSAQVQLETEPGLSSTVSVVGGVGNPGSYPLMGRDRTVLNILAEAGGIQPALNNPQIRLIRDGQIYGTSVDRLYANPGLDTTVRGGDRIIVEPDERYFLSLGAARTEALHRFDRDELTALEALSIVGGLTDARADPKGILILREYPPGAVGQGASGPGSTRVVFVVDLTTADGLFSAGKFPIHSGDLVYVSESPLTVAQTVFGLVGSVFGLARQATLVD